MEALAVQPDWLTITTDPMRLTAAVLLAMAYALFCFGLSSRRKRRTPVVNGNTGQADQSTLLIAFASQTGFAEQIALQTAAALRTAGVAVALEPLAHLRPERLPAAGRALFVVSTTGEGDPPDSAAGFTGKIMDAVTALPTLRYGLLALGDREYRNFCGFGRRLDSWLKARGAQPLFEAVEVDNGDEQALQRWRERLAGMIDAAATLSWQATQSELWRLRERRLANPGSAGQPTYYIALEPPDPTSAPSWEVGDIVEIRPRHDVASVVRFLETAKLDGSAGVRVAGQTMSLADLVARSVLPAEISHSEAQAVADALVPLPYREFSIASLPADGAIELLIRQSRGADGRLGLASGWLTEHAWPDARIELRIRPNTSFRLPPYGAPLILIGNGTGIAGLRPHLKARALAGSKQNWLIFGERNAAADFYYRNELLDWLAQGTLTRGDWTFSRDGVTKRYVQHAVLEAAHELREWVARGAYIYVCGSLDGMAPAVDGALTEMLGADAVKRLIEDGRYRREVY